MDVNTLKLTPNSHLKFNMLEESANTTKMHRCPNTH